MKHTITPLNSSLLHNEDRIAIADNLYHALKSKLSEDKDCITLLDQVNKDSSTLQTALTYAKRPSVFTPRLKTIVDRRTAILRLIKRIIQAHAGNIVEQRLAKAAHKLTYDIGNAICPNTMRNYNDGSFAADVILRACSMKENREHVKHLGLATAVTELEKTQMNFAEIYAKKVTLGHKTKKLNISKTSSMLLDSLQNLCNYISSQAFLKKGIYSSAVEMINEIIKDVIKEIRKRKTIKQNKKKLVSIKNNAKTVSNKIKRPATRKGLQKPRLNIKAN